MATIPQRKVVFWRILRELIHSKKSSMQSIPKRRDNGQWKVRELDGAEEGDVTTSSGSPPYSTQEII